MGSAGQVCSHRGVVGAATLQNIGYYDHTHMSTYFYDRVDLIKI